MVIGAGHNGLVAANYLCDAGFSVMVIEANERIGGMTSTGTPIASAPQHLINNFSIDSFFWDSFPPSRDLQLHRYGLRLVELDPGHLYLHPEGGSIAFFKDPTRTADDIRRFSVRDARAYLEFVPAVQAFAELAMQMGKSNPTKPDLSTLADTVRRAFGVRHELGEMLPLALKSISETIAERFTHQVVRDALHASSGSTIPNDISGTGVAFVWIGNMHRHVCRRAIGGIQTLPDALANRLTSKGGSVLTGSPVTEITVDHDRATGVRLADGSHIRARQTVLATCDPCTTLDKLLPDGVLSESSHAAVRSIPVNNLGYGQMKVDLALSGRTTMKRHQAWRTDGLDVRKPTHMIGTEEGMRRLFARSGAGLVPRSRRLCAVAGDPDGAGSQPGAGGPGHRVFVQLCRAVTTRGRLGGGERQGCPGNCGDSVAVLRRPRFARDRPPGAQQRGHRRTHPRCRGQHHPRRHGAEPLRSVASRARARRLPDPRDRTLPGRRRFPSRRRDQRWPWVCQLSDGDQGSSSRRRPWPQGTALDVTTAHASPRLIAKPVARPPLRALRIQQSDNDVNERWF